MRLINFRESGQIILKTKADVNSVNSFLEMEICVREGLLAGFKKEHYLLNTLRTASVATPRALRPTEPWLPIPDTAPDDDTPPERADDGDLRENPLEFPLAS